jgi:hypothetical protein
MTAVHCPTCQKVHEFRRPPQAERVPETWGEAVRRNLPEIVFGVVILLTFWIGIPWLAGMAA